MPVDHLQHDRNGVLDGQFGPDRSAVQAGQIEHGRSAVQVGPTAHMDAIFYLLIILALLGFCLLLLSILRLVLESLNGKRYTKYVKLGTGSWQQHGKV